MSDTGQLPDTSPPRAGALLVIAILASIAATALAAPVLPQLDAPVRADSCGTGWRSTKQPPTTIRVLRTRSGSVELVGMRDYVAIVMASGEFPAWLPDAVLQVGATAVKQYAWYYALAGHHRPGYRTSSGACYDVRDDTMDQLFLPERAHPQGAQVAAIDATWRLTLRKQGRFFLTGYRSGSAGRCASDADGWRIYTRSAQDCADRKGWSRRRIQEAYYGNKVTFVWAEPSPGVAGQPDREAPSVSVPRLQLVAGQRLDEKTGRVLWTGSDRGGSLLSRYQLQRRVGGGPWRDVRLQGVRAVSYRFRVPADRDIRFRVRAIDGAGNPSGWRASPWIDARVIQSQQARFRGGWKTLRKPAASGGTSRYTTHRDARATLTFRGRGVAIVAAVGPDRGRARIIVDGTPMGTIDLRQARSGQRRLVWAHGWRLAGKHTVRIVTLGTQGRPRFDLDAYLVTR